MKPAENLRNVEQVIIPSEKKKKLIESRIVFKKMQHCKLSKLLNDSTASQFVARKLIEVNDYRVLHILKTRISNLKAPC